MTKKSLQNTNNYINTSSDSLEILAKRIVSETNQLLNRVEREEDLKVKFESILTEIRKGLGLNYEPKYEYQCIGIHKGRIDAIHRQVIIEYKKPGFFDSDDNINRTYNQLVGYLQNVENTQPTKLVGVGFDGRKIFFVKNRNGNWVKEPTESAYNFNSESAETFLIHLRALSRLPLTAENLVQKFGLEKSELAEKILSALINALKNWGNQTHIQTFFNEWKRLFGIVYGEKLTRDYKEKEVRRLSNLYKPGANNTLNFQEFLFCIHTYFAFLMKLITVEILTLRETSFVSSFASDLANSDDNNIKSKLEDIENGGIYARKGITNFLEGDFFSWYLFALNSPELKKYIREIARTLSEFEPATSTLDPTSTRDLFKKLYQGLVPQEVRRGLGEYYTPDWLAELLLDEVGYDGNIDKRLLDPACGSGTFLVLAIQRAIKYGKEKGIDDSEIAKKIVKNIWGFDLNPLAVIAARANYLFALGDLVNKLLANSRQVEIPIYLTDSVLHYPTTSKSVFGNYLKVSTSVNEFQIPVEWLNTENLLLPKATQLVENFAKSRYSVEDAMKEFEKEGLVTESNRWVVEDFYKKISDLEKNGKNGIWARFLKNAFAPMFAGKFDYVVGNPPWIRWGYLSETYRRETLNLWKKYNLFPKNQNFANRNLGGGEKDFSMLFTYASADYYLKNGAKLGFLITQEVFKSKGAGEGFRQFELGSNQYLKVLKAHDFVSIQPFEGTANKTAAIILEKGNKTEYPFPYFVWTKKEDVGRIDTDKLLYEVISSLEKKELFAKPIDGLNGPWQTISNEQECLNAIKGKNSYKAYRGASTEPYGVFWLRVEEVLTFNNRTFIQVSNLTEKGKRDVNQVKYVVETDLVYPAIRGRDIKRWRVEPKIFVLVTHKLNGEVFSEEEMKKSYPNTFEYLTNFKNELLSRGSKVLNDLAKKTSFFTMFGIGDYTFAKYKVIWKRMSNDIVAAVISQAETPFGYKTIIGTDTTTFFATNCEDEAHYLCAIINSKPVRDFIKSFSSPGRGFGAPSVMKYVGILKFDPSNDLHLDLAKISKECHDLKLKGNEEEIKKKEEENNELVKKLFNI